jgi:hypothetical protein
MFVMIVLCLILAKFVNSCFCWTSGFFIILCTYIFDDVGEELPGTSFNNYGSGCMQKAGVLFVALLQNS